ncbi:MAG: phospholipase D-like domain-containing protein [Bdellovibrionota bacterium]
MKKLILGLIVTLAVQSVFADKIVLLDGTKESIEARKDLISSAQTEIRAQYYTIENDEVANGGLAILRDLAIAKPNVRIRIIVDSMHNLILRETMAAFLSDNQGNALTNIEIKEYNKFKIYAPWRYTKRMHDKGLIIDNDILISGGRNIANGYFGKADKENPTHPVLEDTDILVLQSQAISEAATYFDNLWASKFVKTVQLGKMSISKLKPGACEAERAIHDTDQDVKSCEHFRKRNAQLVGQQRTELIQLAIAHRSTLNKSEALEKWLSNKGMIQVGNIDYIFDNPVGQKSSLQKPEALENNIAEQLYAAIKTAQKSVVIITPYLIITPEQESLFAELRARRVKVRIFTNGQNSNNVPVAHVGYLKTRELALKHGVQIWEYNGPDTLHAKMVLIDRNKMFVGSFNWDFRSQNLNREVGIIAQLEEGNQVKVDETDVFAKVARIYERSTRLGNTRLLNKDIGDAGEFDEDEISILAKEISSGNKNIRFWQIIYPLIKKQL